MPIEVDENIVGMWYIDLPPGTNWLAALSKNGDKHKLIYRFRYSKSDDPWDKKDVKNWYEGELFGTEAEAVEKVRTAVKILVAKAEKAEPYELLRGTATVEQFMKQWMEMPFSHAKVQKDQ